MNTVLLFCMCDPIRVFGPPADWILVIDCFFDNLLWVMSFVIVSFTFVILDKFIMVTLFSLSIVICEMLIGLFKLNFSSLFSSIVAETCLG